MRGCALSRRRLPSALPSSLRHPGEGRDPGAHLRGTLLVVTHLFVIPAKAGIHSAFAPAGMTTIPRGRLYRENCFSRNDDLRRGCSCSPGKRSAPGLESRPRPRVRFAYPGYNVYNGFCPSRPSSAERASDRGRDEDEEEQGDVEVLEHEVPQPGRHASSTRSRAKAETRSRGRRRREPERCAPGPELSCSNSRASSDRSITRRPSRAV